MKVAGRNAVRLFFRTYRFNAAATSFSVRADGRVRLVLLAGKDRRRC